MTIPTIQTFHFVSQQTSVMELLPKEILCKIFQFLSADELLKLTALCRAFNDAISGDLKLVRKFRLYFRKTNFGENSIGSRRYEQLRIGFFKPNHHFAILHDIGDRLVNLSFRNCKFKLDLVRKILLCAANVTHLSFERLKLSDVPNVLKKPLPVLNVIKLCLSIESDPRVFRVLQNCVIKELTLSQTPHDGFDDFKEFERFIRMQKKLKHLSVDGLCKTSLFSDTTLDKVDFQLESFSVKNCLFYRTVHLKSFMENQTETLQKVEICDVESCDFSTVLNRLGQLKSIIVSNTNLHYLEVLPTVEALSIEGHKIDGNLLDHMPCIQQLHLKFVRNRKMLENISQNMKELESVFVTDGTIEGMRASSMKILSLVCVDNCPDDFWANNNKIEILIIENCAFICENSIEKILKTLKSLRSLSLLNQISITNKCLLTIRDNCVNLQMVMLRGVNKDLDWKLVEDTRKIKIYIN